MKEQENVPSIFWLALNSLIGSALICTLYILCLRDKRKFYHIKKYCTFFCNLLSEQANLPTSK